MSDKEHELENLVLPSNPDEDDPTAAARKRDHIELAFRSQVEKAALDDRFYYEPLMAAHPQVDKMPKIEFLGKQLSAPLWVSSMTGGTEMAKIINHNLARACQEFGIGMGLGSCRSLLFGNETLPDFDVRPIMGNEVPLFANLGIAQVEQLIDHQELYRIPVLINKLKADGLIIHVNPFQEWLQPEGDHLNRPPIETIEQVLAELDIPIIVKEVGQGMGYRSLKALLQLPVAAIDFAANGGTNFAKLELARSSELEQEAYGRLANIGHGAEEMVELCNRLVEELGDKRRCSQIIISGGIRHFLDGYYLTEKCTLPSIYGQASQFLKHARGDYETLRSYVMTQIKGLALSQTFLSLKA
ncbi:MAG: type 2 isopentenyl-diphosphate Delta-isomerase [Cyanothece sp. SIO1E1]|nr:type 2 isopentenyl-diphosphate Delta-isomerase [Cyanothece sp. SIO1E1]